MKSNLSDLFANVPIDEVIRHAEKGLRDSVRGQVKSNLDSAFKVPERDRFVYGVDWAGGPDTDDVFDAFAYSFANARARMFDAAAMNNAVAKLYKRLGIQPPKL